MIEFTKTNPNGEEYVYQGVILAMGALLKSIDSRVARASPTADKAYLVGRHF